MVVTVLKYAAPKTNVAATRIEINPLVPGRVEREMARCCHCERYWIIEPGSGRKRGFCMGCNAVNCGAQACVEKCNPWERQFEAMRQRQRFFETIERKRSG